MSGASSPQPAAGPALEYQQRLFALLSEVVGLDREARDALLAGVDPELAEGVRSLLDSKPGDSFLEQAPAGLAAGDIEPETLEPGREIGPYRILELIGTGGMGQVYLAEQERPVRRRVAIKVLVLTVDQPQLLRRFDTERQAMERLDHPYIGKILDAGPMENGGSDRAEGRSRARALRP